MGTTLEAVRRLLPAVAAQAAQVERDRALPGTLLKDLTEAGCFRMKTPRRFGGDELPLTEVIEVIAALSRADASVGWCVGQHCAGQLLLNDFPEAAIEDAYADGPDLLMSGANAPKGRALRTDGGWRVSGRWSFVSGCPWATRISAICRVNTDDGPGLLMVLFPAGQTRIHDTWSVTGLAGTASHDVSIQGFCPDGHCYLLDPDSGFPKAEQGSLFVAAVAAGIAGRALDEITALAATGKRPLFSADTLSASPLFQHRLGRADMTLRAAFALLREQAAVVGSGEDTSPVARGRAYASGPAITALAKEVAAEAFELGGGSAVYQTSELQRALRNVQTAGQHFLNGPFMPTRLGVSLLEAAHADTSG